MSSNGVVVAMTLEVSTGVSRPDRIAPERGRWGGPFVGGSSRRRDRGRRRRHRWCRGRQFERLLVVAVITSVLVGTVAAESGVAVAAVDPSGAVDATALTGSGTAADPYRIATAADLQAMPADLDAYYVLVADVDASETAGWNGGAGFTPVGTETAPFRGSFDGRGHTVSGLTVDRSGTDHVGLFGVTEWAVVDDVRLVDASVVGQNGVGGLVGTADVSILTDVTVTGTVTGVDGVGGLVGVSRSYVQVLDASAAATVRGANEVGGLVGATGENSLVLNAETSGDVTGEQFVGGLVGANRGSSVVLDAEAAGDVTGELDVGGLVGEHVGRATISKRYAVGDLTNGVVMRSAATGEVTGRSSVGGLVGSKRESVVIDAAASGDVEATDESAPAGGLVGRSGEGLVTGSVATGRVTATNAGAEAGGLVGEQQHSIVSRSAATGAVAGGGYAGGLVGESWDESVVSRSYATGRVTGDSRVGGLVGFLVWDGRIFQSYASGPVVSGGTAGGLVGSGLFVASVDGTYWDVETSGRVVGIGEGSSGEENGTGLPTARMTGAAAREAMPAFDYPDEWRTTETYPVLAWQVDGGTGAAGGDRERALARGDGGPVAPEAGPIVGVDTSRRTPASTAAAATAAPDAAGGPVEPAATTTAMTGSGTAADPYRITTAADLQAMAADRDAHYVLAGDVDAAETAGWNDGAGFAPVGNDTAPFAGSLDGDGHVVSGLTIDRPGADEVGLFGALDRGGDVRDLQLEDVRVAGRSAVGGLAGNNDGAVSRVVVTGRVEGTRTVGGLAGRNQGTVTASVSAATVRGVDRVGGLVGTNAGPRSPARGPLRSAVLVTGSTATGDVTGERNVGGLVGENVQATVVDSAAAGDVDGGEARVGGLVGVNDRGTVIGSAARGDVTGGERTGGLVGYSLVGDVVDAAARGDVTGGERTGGLVGYLEGSVLVGSAATGNVTGDADVGGLVGFGFISTMSNSYARGAVDGSTRVGGLVGYHSGGPLHATYATGLVAKSDGGGLIGRKAADHPVASSYWDREATTRLGSSGGGTRLDTARMTGDAVREHMPGLDVPDDWYLTDSYPVLAWEAADPFLAVDVTGVTTPLSAGDTLRVNGTVYNFGGVPGNGTVTLRDTDFRGQVQDVADVTLPAGESTPVQLTWRTRPGDAGIGTVTVATGDDADAVDVRLVDGPVAEASLVNVTLAAAPNGFTEYYIVVRIPGQTVQDVRPVLVTEASGNPGFQVWDGGVGTDTVGASGGGFPAIDPFNDTRTLFSVNVTGDVLASDVELTVESLRGLRGDMNESLVGIDVTRVVVVPPSPFTGPAPGSAGRGPPGDLDGDGRFEDVDGDGQFDFVDAIDLVFVDADRLTPSQAAAFDFDGSGAFDFVDVVELVFRL
jgi:hypothetical protein